jgi:hypothetical protein
MRKNMARILREDWFAVAQGDIYPVLHQAGSELTGELLRRAEGLGKMVDSETPAQTRAREKAEAKAAQEAEAARLAQEEAERLAAEEEAARKAAEGGEG